MDKHSLATIFDHPHRGLCAHTDSIAEARAYASIARHLRLGGKVPVAVPSEAPAAVRRAVELARDADPEDPSTPYRVIDAAHAIVREYFRPSGILHGPLRAASWVRWAQEELQK